MSNPGFMVLPEVYHDAWHVLFGNMTPWEACLFVEVAMTQRTRKGWDKARLLRLRIQIIRSTENIRKSRHPLDPLARRSTKVDGPIRFDHLPGWWRDLHEFLFADLPSVARVHAFIYELMVVEAKFTGPEIIRLRGDVARRNGLRLVSPAA